MTIEFDVSIFNTLEHSNEFSFLYNLCFLDKKHEIFIDIEEVRDTPLFSTLSKSDQIIIEGYYNKFINDNPEINYCITVEEIQHDYQLDLKMARKLLSASIMVILEHSINDRPFLLALVRNFKKRSKKIARYLANEWIDFRSSNGCGGVKPLVEEQLDKFKNFPRNASSYIRMFVLIDSDSRYHGNIQPTRTALGEYLDELQIPYHFLYKREMENYLPEEVYDTIQSNGEFISAYKRLSPQQKDFIDIENGFYRRDANASLDQLAPEVQDLFANLHDNDKTTFRNKRFNMEDFKKDFPMLFYHQLVTQDTLKFRVAHQESPEELEEILEKLNLIL